MTSITEITEIKKERLNFYSDTKYIYGKNKKCLNKREYLRKIYVENLFE